MPNSPSSPDFRPSILFIDDDADVQKAAALLLPRRGFSLLSARDPAEAWSVLSSEPVDVVLLDLNFRPGSVSGAEGFACLEALITHDPDMVVVIVTGHSGINIAVAAMRAGATDFVMKPWNNERLVATLTDAVAVRRQRRNAHPFAPPAGEAPPPDSPIIGDSLALRRILEPMRRAAATDAPILLLGEAGTGKSLLAHSIHRLSSRADRSFTTLDPMALWSEGEGAWTTALAAVSPDDTLFLDEVGELPQSLQARLLAFLNERPHLRLVTASRQKRDALHGGMLQSDLLYRLNIVELSLPPLRERGDDVRLLATHFLHLFARRYQRPALTLAPDALDIIASASWPGNIRALAQAMERAVVLASGTVLHPADIPIQAPLPDGVAAARPGDGDLNLTRSEKAIVEAALRRHGFNVSHAATDLGLSRAALYRRMARHGL
ncbi:MAG: sigma-54-dependent transcriptional regulator [Janthinobacterium lividum]